MLWTPTASIAGTAANIAAAAMINPIPRTSLGRFNPPFIVFLLPTMLVPVFPFPRFGPLRVAHAPSESRAEGIRLGGFNRLESRIENLRGVSGDSGPTSSPVRRFTKRPRTSPDSADRWDEDAGLRDRPATWDPQNRAESDGVPVRFAFDRTADSHGGIIRGGSARHRWSTAKISTRVPFNLEPT